MEENINKSTVEASEKKNALQRLGDKVEERKEKRAAKRAERGEPKHPTLKKIGIGVVLGGAGVAGTLIGLKYSKKHADGLEGAEAYTDAIDASYTPVE